MPSLPQHLFGVARSSSLGFICIMCLLTVTAEARAQVDIRKFCGRLDVDLGPNKTQTGSVTFANLLGEAWLLTAYHNFRGVPCADAGCVWVRLPGKRPLAWAQLTTGGLHVLPKLGVVAAKVSPEGMEALRQRGARFVSGHGASTDSELDSLVSQTVQAVGNPRLQILGESSVAENYVGSGTIGERQLVSARLPEDGYLTMSEDTELWYVDGITITHGYSGGPLLFNAQLVGIVQGGDAETGQKSWAIPIHLIRRELETNGEGQVVAFPGATLPAWPPDGFKDYLYSTKYQSEYLVRDISTPRGPLRSGELQTVSIILKFASLGARSDLVVALKGRSFVNVESSAAPVLQGTTLQKLEWSVRIEEGSPKELELVFSVRDTDGKEVAAVRRSFEVRKPSQALIGPRLGYGFYRADDMTGGQYATNEASLAGEVEPALPLVPWLELVGRVGLGVARIWTTTRDYDPPTLRILDKKKSSFWGVGVDGSAAVRFAILPALRAEVAGTASLLNVGLKDRWEYAMGPEVGIQLRFENGRAIAARFCAAFTKPFPRDRRYETITELESVETNWTLGGKAHLAYAF